MRGLIFALRNTVSIAAYLLSLPQLLSFQCRRLLYALNR